MMGGSDPGNLSGIVIEALSLLGRHELVATVMVGGSNPHLEKSRHQAGESNLNLRLEVDAKNVPELMQSADLAISAAGSTCWEICMLGLPAIVIDAAPNQLPVAHELDRRLMAMHISRAQATPAYVAAKIEVLLNAHKVRLDMSRRASEA